MDALNLALTSLGRCDFGRQLIHANVTQELLQRHDLQQRRSDSSLAGYLKVALKPFNIPLRVGCYPV